MQCKNTLWHRVPKTPDEGQKALPTARWAFDRTADRGRPSADRGGSLETRPEVEKVCRNEGKDLERNP